MFAMSGAIVEMRLLPASKQRKFGSDPAVSTLMSLSVTLSHTKVLLWQSSILVKELLTTSSQTTEVLASRPLKLERSLLASWRPPSAE